MGLKWGTQDNGNEYSAREGGTQTALMNMGTYQTTGFPAGRNTIRMYNIGAFCQRKRVQAISMPQLWSIVLLLLNVSLV